MILAVVLFLMLSLLASHTFLMITGHTTWEYISWAKISYLQEQEKQWMSPFSEGVCANVKLYWATSCKSRPHTWKLFK